MAKAHTWIKPPAGYGDLRYCEHCGVREKLPDMAAPCEKAPKYNNNKHRGDYEPYQ